MRLERLSHAIAALALIAACDSGQEAEAPAPEPAVEEAEEQAEAPAAEPAAAKAPSEGATPPPVPEGAKVFWVTPEAGVIEGPERDGKVIVPVEMGAEGILVEAAGEQKEGSGHHHILVDVGPLAKGTAVPKDATHLHFGKGQTEAELELPPGKHELTLQFADGLHLSYGPELSATIEVEAKSTGEKAPPAE